MNEEILKKAIKKAVNGGYNPPSDVFLSNSLYFIVILSHEFAKAFWGEKIR